jgi:glycosyltransferase involved in cell wall biosynthesis
VFPRSNPSHPASGLRIAVASSGLGHVARGIEGWAQDVAAALFARGETVTLFKGSGRAERPYERVVPCVRRDHPVAVALDSGIPQRLAWRLGIGTSHGLEQTTFALNLLRRLRRGRHDILHVQDPRVALIVQRARRLGLVRTRVILGHGTNEPPEFLRKIEFLQHLSPWHLERRREEGAWRETWTAIPNFVDTEVFRPDNRRHGRTDARRELGIPQDALVVLTVAAVKRTHKRVHHLVSEFAAARATHPRAPLWLVVAGGEDPETTPLVSWAKELLGDRVRFLIGHPRRQMPDLYRAADLFAFASLREMMPMALVEATASALPSLVHEHPIMKWIAGPGGVAVDMETPGTLSTAIARLAADTTERSRISVAARSWCERHFSSERVIDQVLNYYHFVARHGAQTNRVEQQEGGSVTTAEPSLA